MRQSASQLSLVFLLVGQVRGVAGGAVFALQLLSFDNQGNKEWSGACCDGPCFFNNRCDPGFTVCLDDVDGGAGFQSCAYYRGKSWKYGGQTKVTFGRSIKGGIPNPLVLRTDSWPGALQLKVLVMDGDSANSDDVMDKLHKALRLRPHRSEVEAPWVPHTIQGTRTKASPSRLVVRTRLYCSADFYGPQCAVECYERDDDLGHYLCDPDTGDIVCRPGWENEVSNCTIPADDCTGVTCQNGGTCVDRHMHYACVCAEGYFGDFCQQHVCDNVTCLNGGTCLNEGECLCAQGFFGDRCEKLALQHSQGAPDEGVPLWVIVVLSVGLAILLMNTTLILCRRCRRRAADDKVPLVHHNPTYDTREEAVCSAGPCTSTSSSSRAPAQDRAAPNIYTLSGSSQVDAAPTPVYDVPGHLYEGLPDVCVSDRASVLPPSPPPPRHTDPPPTSTTTAVTDWVRESWDSVYSKFTK